MGYILPEIYQSLCQSNNMTMPKVFVETGTYKGGIAHHIIERTKKLDECFNHYYTIELSEDICKCASKRYKYIEEYNFDVPYDKLHTDEMDHMFNKSQSYFNNRLTLINGDSAVELKNVLDKLNEPACFWLDAHSGAQQYAKGDQDVPLLSELDHIRDHHIKSHIIAIDDAHLFGKTQIDKQGNVVCDYSHVTFDIVKEKLLEINPLYDVGLYAPYNMLMILAYVQQ
jgi:hypothetical protein